jgi:uncharacterized iron-regulated protein
MLIRKVISLPFLAILLAVLAADGKARGAQADNLWIDVYQGEPVQYEDVLDDLAAARVVYLGERHTLERHHAMQAQIVSDLAGKGRPLALGLEQMETSQQPHLDRYNRGERDFEQLAEATAWPKRWKNYRQYRPVLEAARKAKAPVVALNAKFETIRQVVRSGGIERLPADVRKELPSKVLLPDPPYEKLLHLQMMMHAAATPETLRPMVEAQIARDEAMAEAAAAFLKSEQGRGRTMLVLCGAGHAAYGQGLPTRVRQRLPDVKERIVLFSESGEVQLSPAEKAQARPIEITHEQLRELRLPIADYLWVKPLDDPAERLSAEVRRILSSVRSTEYSHKTQIDEQQGKYLCDCSGLACYVLQQKFPQHYKAIPKPKGRARPLAVDFYRFFSGLPAAPPRDGWQQVPSLLDARPGDILAWKSDNPKPGASTGHVVFIDGRPVRDKDGQVRVEIIDSTSRGHGNDTRKSGQTGIGRGTMWFSVDDQGRPTGYRWSSARGKLQQPPIAIGRVVESPAPSAVIGSPRSALVDSR